VSRFFFLLVSILILTSQPVRGDIILYNTRADFNAATVGRTVIDFEGIASDGGFMFLPTPTGITLSGVNFTIDHTNNNGNLFVIGRDRYYAGNSVLSSQESTIGRNNLVTSFPGVSTAFALDFGSFSSTPFIFTLSTGDTFIRPTPGFFDEPNTTFVGVTSSVPISSFRIDLAAAGDVLNIDNFTMGTAVPEPASLVLFVFGSLGLFGYGWRWRRRKSSVEVV
jgi:hypothetical protein